jgi:hypothetical protein
MASPNLNSERYAAIEDHLAQADLIASELPLQTSKHHDIQNELRALLAKVTVERLRAEARDAGRVWPPPPQDT